MIPVSTWGDLAFAGNDWEGNVNSESGSAGFHRTPGGILHLIIHSDQPV